MRTDKIEKPDYYTQREWNRIRAREKAQARATRNLVFAALLMLAVALACLYPFSRPPVVKAYDKAMAFLYKPFGKLYSIVVK